MKKFLVYLLLSLLTVSLSACAPKEAPTPPTPPPPTILGTQLRADPGNHTVTLDWKMVKDAETYNIYYIPDSGYNINNLPSSTEMKAGTKITGRPSATYIVTGLTNRTKYWFALTAVNDNGESNLSETISSTPFTPPPPASPKDVRANAGNGQVTVTWAPVSHVAGVPDVASYNIHCIRAEGYYKTGTGIITVNGQSSNSYVVKKDVLWNVGTAEEGKADLVNGTLYGFGLTAETAESGSSAVAKATPGNVGSTHTSGGTVAAVTVDATVTAGTTKTVTISWTPLADAPPNTSYNLYYYPTLTGTPITRIPEVMSPYTLASPADGLTGGLTDGTQYSFYLKSVIASDPSFSVTATPSDPAPPAAPVLTVSEVGNAKVTLTWPPVSGATSYHVYVGLAKGVTQSTGELSKVAVLTNPMTTTATLKNDVTYYIVVTAVQTITNGDGSTNILESTESNEVWATPSATAGTYMTGGLTGGQTSGTTYMGGVQATISGSVNMGAH